MKAIRLVLLAFALLIAGFVVLGLFQRHELRVERSIVVAAPVERVASWLADVRHWPEFLPADEHGAKITYSFGARTEGPGAELVVETANGKATMRVLGVDASGLRYAVSFSDGSNAMSGEIAWNAEGSGTRVTMKDRGEVGWNPIPRFLLGVIERGVGAMREQCLARMKERLEAPSDASAPAKHD